jgi:hypothetical protein
MNMCATVAVGFAFLLGLYGTAAAQVLYPEPAPEPTPSTECRYAFGSEGFAWCVSENGNVVTLTSPAGAEHLRVGNVAEGYVLCVPGGQPYYDVGVIDAGWGPATLVKEVGVIGVAVERTTTDGRFRLRQDIVGNKLQRSITVFMTLTNLLEDAVGVQVLRHADFDVDNTFGDDMFDRSSDGTWARQLHALTLSAADVEVPHQSRISADLAPRTCTPASTLGLPAADGDLAASVRYDLGELASGASRTVTFIYRVQ